MAKDVRSVRNFFDDDLQVHSLMFSVLFMKFRRNIWKFCGWHSQSVLLQVGNLRVEFYCEEVVRKCGKNQFRSMRYEG